MAKSTKVKVKERRPVGIRVTVNKMPVLDMNEETFRKFLNLIRVQKESLTRTGFVKQTLTEENKETIMDLYNCFDWEGA